MPPCSLQQSLRKLRVGAPAWLALATPAAHNRAANTDPQLQEAGRPDSRSHFVWISRGHAQASLQKHSVFAIICATTWEIRYHDEKLQEAVLALPAGLLARYLHLTDRMLQYGPDLGMPHTRAMGAGLFELRLKSQEGIGRVFYCTLVKRRIVMLHQFVKKTDKTPPKELVVARKRMKEWKDADA